MTFTLEKSLDQLKWALPCTLFTGYLLTIKDFDSNIISYFAYSMTALLFCIILVAKIKLYEQKSVALCMVLFLFTWVYFLRFYWIAIDPVTVQSMLPSNSYFTMVADKVGLAEAFRLTVAAFVSFGLAAVVSFRFTAKDSNSLHSYLPEGDRSRDKWISVMLLSIVTPLMLVLAYVSYKYHIGEMGAETGEALPFRLKGVVFYARTVAIPLTLLLSVYLFDRSGFIVWSRFAAIILILHGIIDMLLRNSRGSLLLTLLLIVFLVMSRGLKIRVKEKVVVCIMMVLAIYITPVMYQYRVLRLNLNLSYSEAFLKAIDAVRQDWFTQIISGLKFVIFRPPGIESIWCILSLGGGPLGARATSVILSKYGVAGYLTFVIHSSKETDNMLLAPGFVGWCYLVNGLSAVIIVAFITGLLSIIGWKYLDVKYLKCSPVAKAFFLWMMFLVLTEGTIDGMVHMFVVGSLTLATLELGLRINAQKIQR